MKAALVAAIVIILIVGILVASKGSGGKSAATAARTGGSYKLGVDGKMLAGTDLKAEGPYAAVEGFCGAGACPMVPGM